MVRGGGHGVGGVFNKSIVQAAFEFQENCLPEIHIRFCGETYSSELGSLIVYCTEEEKDLLFLCVRIHWKIYVLPNHGAHTK